MASGTIQGTCYDLSGAVTTKYLFYAEYKTGTPSAEGNYTPLTVALKVRRNPDQAWAASSYNLDNQVTVVLKVDGVEVFRTTTADVDTRNAQVWTFTTKTPNVAHQSDGTKTVAIEASFSGVNVSSLHKGTLSGSVKLETIPRASAIDSAGAVTLGGKCSVKWTPASASFRYKLKFSLGGWSYTTGAIHPNKTSAYTYSGYAIPLEVANQIPNAKTGTMAVTLYTYSDSGAVTQVGGEDTAAFAVTVPNNDATEPTVAMELAPVSALAAPFDALYIQGRSKVDADFSGAGKYGASVAAYKVTVNGADYASPYTSGYLPEPGEVTVTGTATDSRGHSNTAAQKIEVIAYSKPKILPASGESEIVCARCDAGGKLADSGTYLKIKARRSYSKVVSGGIQKNFCAIRYRYKAASASAYSAWVTILAKDSIASDEVETGALLGGVLAPNSSYMVQIQAVDDVGDYAETTIGVPTDAVYMHRTKNAMGLGKYAEGENLLDVGWDAHFHGEVRIGAAGMTLKDYILTVINEGG